MGQQTRMFKILAALALSMIGGALLLYSSGPGLTHTSSRPALLLHAQGQSNRQSGEWAAYPWQDVVVLCDVAPAYNILQDKGLGGTRRAHLAVNERGLIRIQPAWERREELDGYESALVIRLELAPWAVDLSAVQYDALKSLLDHLASRLELPMSRVRCEFHHPNVASLTHHLRRTLNDRRSSSLVD